MTEFIIDLTAWGGYFGIFVLMVLENVFPPIPSEVIMGLGGIAVARGQMEVAAADSRSARRARSSAIISGTRSGRRFGYRGLKPWVDRHGRWLTVDWHEVERLHAFFTRHGEWIVFVFRFMPAFRTIISLPAGMTCMPRWRFLLLDRRGQHDVERLPDLGRLVSRYELPPAGSVHRTGSAGDHGGGRAALCLARVHVEAARLTLEHHLRSFRAQSRNSDGAPDPVSRLRSKRTAGRLVRVKIPRPADARSDTRRADAPHRPQCRSGSS